MTDHRPRLKLRIDSIVSDRALDQAALDAALRRELQLALSTEGAAAFRPGGNRPQADARIAEGSGPTAGRVAQAIVGAVRR